MWYPPSIQTERKLGVLGCECLGTGFAGTMTDDKQPGILVTHKIPCRCMYAVIHNEQELSVIESEVNGHYMDRRNGGGWCGCIWCVQREKELKARGLDKNLKKLGE
jgi:hypothetical protein